jgi:hypothetical protein
MGRTRHESRDYPVSRAIGPAGQTHTGETQRPEGHVLSLWTALPLQVDFEKIRLGPLQTSIRRHPMRSGRPNGESARARLYSW